MAADVAAHIKAKIRAGRLPLPDTAPGKIWVGQSDGAACDACDDVIARSSLEYEVDLGGGRSLRFHATCLAAWQQERAERLTE